jgi:hypothetical protein
MSLKTFKTIVVWWSLTFFIGTIGWAQERNPQGWPMMPFPQPPSMKACGDYLFVLQGATLQRVNLSTSQVAGSISLMDGINPKDQNVSPPQSESSKEQKTQEPSESQHFRHFFPHPGLRLTAGSGTKSERLLVLLGNRLFVVDPVTFTKPTAIVLPDPHPEEKSQSPVSAKATAQPGHPGHPGELPPPLPGEMDNPPMGPGAHPGQSFQGGPGGSSGPQPMGFGSGMPPPFPPPPMPQGAFRCPNVGFGGGAMPMPPGMMQGPAGPSTRQIEVKGQKHYMMRGPQLVAVDYLTGDIKTLDVMEQTKAGK